MANSSSDAAPVSRTDPSRRQFFHTAGIAAGGLYALAAPSLAGPWVAGAEAATDKRAYMSGRFGLELDNAFCGLISAFQGGNLVAEVVTTRQGPGFPTKRLGPVKVEPITIEVGLEMTKPVYEWISKTLNLENARKNGAIVELDPTFKEIGRRTFTNAFISEIEFPALDASSGKTPANITLTIVPEQVKLEGGTGKQAPAPKGQKALLGSNFRLNIQGLEQATQRAVKIEAFGFKQSIVVQQGGQSRTAEKSSTQADFTNLAVLVPESSAGPMYGWFDDFVIKGNNTAAKERPGVLEFLSVDMKTAIAAVQLYGLGVFKISSDPGPSNTEKVRLAKVEMYCQRMTFSP
jgi:hypothetical protein